MPITPAGYRPPPAADHPARARPAPPPAGGAGAGIKGEGEEGGAREEWEKGEGGRTMGKREGRVRRKRMGEEEEEVGERRIQKKRRDHGRYSAPSLGVGRSKGIIRAPERARPLLPTRLVKPWKSQSDLNKIKRTQIPKRRKRE